VDIFVEKALLM